MSKRVDRSGPALPTDCDMSITASDNRRILVIDDNVAILEDFRKVLVPVNASDVLDQARASLFGEAPMPVQGESFAVDFAEQGEAGLRLVKQAAGSRDALRVGLCRYAHAAGMGRRRDRHPLVAG